LDVQPVDCTDVARRVVDGFRPRAVALGLELAIVPMEATPLWVEADADRLGQIVANLVENASSFAHQHIAVGTGMVGRAPAIWVIDDGPGISPDKLGRVFDRHYTSDDSDGRRKGSGLGLAIVSELASAMGAVVEADSPVADGRGARMVVRFHPIDARAVIPSA
jgi:two-component system sensor histidine kinase KdpD